MGYEKIDGKWVAVWYKTNDIETSCWFGDSIKVDGVCPYCGSKRKHHPTGKVKELS